MQVMFLLFMVFIGILSFEAPDLVRKKYWRELIVFSLFLLLAFILSLLQTMGVEIPSPLKGLQYLIEGDII